MISSEINPDLTEEAISELFIPVLHRVEIPELDEILQSEFSTHQRIQEVIRQAVLGGLSQRDSASISRFADESGPKWEEFARKVTWPHFMVLLDKRRETYRSIKAALKDLYDLYFKFFVAHRGTYLGKQEEVDKFRQRFGALARGIYEHISHFYTITEVPFPLHYALTAKGILQTFAIDKVNFIRKLSKPEYVALVQNLREKCGREDLSVPINQDTFPYQKPFFYTGTGNCPLGVKDLGGLVRWYEREAATLIREGQSIIGAQ